jgi:hypothetical protein
MFLRQIGTELGPLSTTGIGRGCSWAVRFGMTWPVMEVSSVSLFGVIRLALLRHPTARVSIYVEICVMAL